MPTWWNGTPHQVDLVRPDGSRVSIPASGHAVRLRVDAELAGDLDGIPVVMITRGGLVSPLPAEALAADAVIVADLVGDQVAAALGRPVYSPDASPDSVIRDGAGRITGVRRLRVHVP